MAYAVLHLVAYAVLVLGLDFSILWQDISQKPYAIAGALAFVGLTREDQTQLTKQIGPSLEAAA